MNNVAWVLSTHEDATVRQGIEAVLLAERVCELTDYQAPHILDTLAAAYAETERYEEAGKTAEKAFQLAQQEKDEELVKRVLRRVELYRIRQPYHSQLDFPESSRPETDEH